MGSRVFIFISLIYIISAHYVKRVCPHNICSHKILKKKRLTSYYPDNRIKKCAENYSLRAGFEPARGDPIGFQVQRLNHSAITASSKIRLTLRLYFVLHSYGLGPVNRFRRLFIILSLIVKSHSHSHVYVVNTEYVVIYIRFLYQVKIFNTFFAQCPMNIEYVKTFDTVLLRTTGPCSRCQSKLSIMAMHKARTTILLHIYRINYF